MHRLETMARLVAAGLCAAAPAAQDPAPRAKASIPGYDLARPSASFDLPPALAEISALTDVDDHTVACVQDEHGVVYFVDLRRGAVTRSSRFGPDGDYEGLTRIGDDLWVLRSDGLVVQLVPHGDTFAVGKQLTLAIGHQDIEGLGYDPFQKHILVVPKDPPEGTKDARRQRFVFAVDPATGKQLEGAVLTRPSSASSRMQRALASSCVEDDEGRQGAPRSRTAVLVGDRASEDRGGVPLRRRQRAVRRRPHRRAARHALLRCRPAAQGRGHHVPRERRPGARQRSREHAAATAGVPLVGAVRDGGRSRWRAVMESRSRGRRSPGERGDRRLGFVFARP
jgi:hypothetical protein